MAEAPLVTIARRPTYVVSERIAVALTHATDDIAQITGAAGGKIVRVKRIVIAKPSADLVNFSLSKRSAANTGGTPTTPAKVPLDSRSAAASAVAQGYTAVPNSGAAVGTIYGPFKVLTTDVLTIEWADDDEEAPTLTTAAEALALVTDTAATVSYTIVWTEYTPPVKKLSPN